jgi:hypothetical protein
MNIFYALYGTHSLITMFTKPTIGPYHSFTSCFSKIHFNIILPPVPTSPKWSLPLKIFQLKFYLHFSLVCYISHLSHHLWFNHPNNISWPCSVGPCHHSTIQPQAVDGGDGLQIWRVAANVLNKQAWTANKPTSQQEVIHWFWGWARG